MGWAKDPVNNFMFLKGMDAKVSQLVAVKVSMSFTEIVFEGKPEKVGCPLVTSHGKIVVDTK